MCSAWHGRPEIIAYGTEAQKKRYPSKILSCEEIWCQGYSEPNAGSDLASLQTRAVKDGDHWCSTARRCGRRSPRFAHWMMLLARTDPQAPRHKGITYFLLDMKLPGVVVKPLRQITGEAEFNEVFLDNVRVHESEVLGGVNNGWQVGITTLMYERLTLGFGLQMRLRIAFDSLIELARRMEKHGRVITKDRCGARSSPSSGSTPSASASPAPGDYEALAREMPGAEASTGKMVWVETHQRLQELAMELEGSYGQLAKGSEWAVEKRRLAALLPPVTRQLHRGRHDGDPEEHHRRAAARPAKGLTCEPQAVAGLPSRRPRRASERERTWISGSARNRRCSARPRGSFWTTSARRRSCARGWRSRRASPTSSGAKLAEQGWLGLVYPEEYGGTALGFVDLTVLMEEMGALRDARAVRLDRPPGARDPRGRLARAEEGMAPRRSRPGGESRARMDRAERALDAAGVTATARESKGGSSSPARSSSVLDAQRPTSSWWSRAPRRGNRPRGRQPLSSCRRAPRG